MAKLPDIKKQYLESAAHAYVSCSGAYRESETKDNRRKKNLARIRLQGEALRFAAEFLDTWTKMLTDGGEKQRKVKGGIDQLRESFAEFERFWNETNR